MGQYTDEEVDLSSSQKGAILELGRRGAGGSFDQMALAELFAMGLVEVRSADRRLVLTGRGRLAYAKLMRK